METLNSLNKLVLNQASKTTVEEIKTILIETKTM